MRKSKTLKPTLPRAINDRCTYRMWSRIFIILQDPRVSDNPELLHVHVEFLFTQISSSSDAPNELGCELHQEQERLLRAKPRQEECLKRLNDPVVFYSVKSRHSQQKT